MDFLVQHVPSGLIKGIQLMGWQRTLCTTKTNQLSFLIVGLLAASVILVTWEEVGAQEMISGFTVLFDALQILSEKYAADLIGGYSKPSKGVR